MKKFDNDFNEISKADIQRIEQLIGSKLPNDYKNHMMNYNGGSVPLWKNYYFEFQDDSITLGRFHTISSLENYFNKRLSFLYPKLLSIGSVNGGSLAIGYQNENFGNIYVYFSDEGPHKIANSFTEFIESLIVENLE